MSKLHFIGRPLFSEKVVSMIASNALGKRYDKAFSSHDDGDTTR